MTVQELIRQLMLIEDKEKPVICQPVYTVEEEESYSIDFIEEVSDEVQLY